MEFCKQIYTKYWKGRAVHRNCSVPKHDPHPNPQSAQQKMPSILGGTQITKEENHHSFCMICA